MKNDGFVSIQEQREVTEDHSDLINAIVEASAGRHITEHHLAIFVRNTPDKKRGAALWREFLNRRIASDDPTYNFGSFIMEVFDEVEGSVQTA